MADASNCPDPRQLQELLLGHLTEQVAHSLEQHVEQCARCSGLLPALHIPDTLVDAMRASARIAEPADRKTLATLIPRLHQLSTQWPAQLADARTNGHAHVTTPPNIPGYEIVGMLGRGGMGVVYKARHVQLQRLVALKMIGVGANAGLEQHKRFLSEARAVARLQHPNIVQIYDIGEHEGLPYFSLELLDRGSLARLIAGTPQAPRRAAEMVEILARAMNYSHQCGVVHRDLKPANILLADCGARMADSACQSTISDPPSALLKITDFGLAKQLDDVGQTHTGAILGTPSYMAPEQARGKLRDVGPATDIYALGAILYELLTGRPPFKGETPFDTVMQVLTQEPVPPRRLQPKVPRDLESICLKCLRPAPTKRYGTAGELAEELARYLRGEPLACTRAVSSTERAWRWCRRNPALATAYGLACVTALALVVLVAGSLFALQESRNAAMQSRLATELAQQQKETQAALELAQQERTRADQLTTLITLDHALTVCEQGEADRGMLWLAGGLTKVPTTAEDLQRVFRANLGACRAEIHPLRYYREQAKPILAVAFSPDGRTFATGTQDKSVQRWDALTGKPIGLRLSHNGWVHSVAFSPDGRTILTGSGDHRARLWDVASGKLLSELVHAESTVWAVAFHPDGRTVLTGSGYRDNIDAGGGEARLWDLASSRVVRSMPHPGSVLAVAVSPGGRSLLTGCGDKAARLWDALSGSLHGAPLSLAGRVQTVAFSPDGQSFLTGTGDGLITNTHRVQVWRTAAPVQPVLSLSHQGNVNTGVFSPDGRTILTGSCDLTAQLWDSQTGQRRGSPLKHLGWVQSAVFSPDGQTILTGSADQGTRLWQVTPAAVVQIPPPSGQPVTAVAFSADGRTIMTGSIEGQVHAWNALTFKLELHSLMHDSGVLALACSPDNRLVLTGGRDRAASLWDRATGQLRCQLSHDTQVTSVAFSRDGKLILTGTAGRSARLWDTATGKPTGQLLKHGSYITASVFDPDARRIATASWDRVQLWDAVTGQMLGKAIAMQGWTQAAAFSPDGRLLVTGSVDGTIRVWNTKTGEPVGLSLVHQGCVHAVAFSPDGLLILSGSADKTARLWDVKTGKRIGSPLVHQGGVRAAVFSPDGGHVLTGCDDHIARLWTVPKPVEGTPEQLVHWTKVITGMELRDDGGFRSLDSKRWKEHQLALTQVSQSRLP
jgi:WD40 repeat protein